MPKGKRRKSGTAHSGALLWNATHEANDYNAEWQTVGGDYSLGGHADSGNGVTVIDTAFAHTGTYALKMTTNAIGGEHGARNFRWADAKAVTLPAEAVYEAWFYWDQNYQPTAWWNIFQFKTRTAYSTSDPNWSINVGYDGSGMKLYWYDHHRVGPFGTSGSGSLPSSTWHKITVQYRFHATNGLVTSWLNGTQWYTESGMQTMNTAPYTAYGFERQWSINNYTDGNTPALSNIWADDASIRMP